MQLSGTGAFLSYARDDDRAEQGRICDLARDIAAAYGLQTGTELELFLDRDSIEWGDDWRAEIGKALEGTAFFIPIVTPRYFQRPECRRELIRFSQVAKELDVEKLILPLLYVDLPEMHDDEVSDEAMILVKQREWASGSTGLPSDLRIERLRSTERQ